MQMLANDMSQCFITFQLQVCYLVEFSMLVRMTHYHIAGSGFGDQQKKGFGDHQPGRKWFRFYLPSQW